MTTVLIAGALPALVTAQGRISKEATGDAYAVGVDEFREALLAYAMSAEALDVTGAVQSEAGLVDRVLALGYEELEAWLQQVADPARYVTLLLDLSVPAMVTAPEAPLVPSEPVARSGALFGPFTPDYPPNSGFYGDWLINQLQIQGLLVSSAPNKERCRLDGANGWGDRFEFWDKSKSAADGLETACISASCDPIGVGCAIACVPFSVAHQLEATSEVAVRECDAHIGNVDSAEIEAAYENTVTLLGNQTHIHMDLNDHDDRLVEVDADLAQHDGRLQTHDLNIDGDLQAHDSRLMAHDSNIDGDLILHNLNLNAHDANIDGDLAAHHAALGTHDVDIKALLATLQGDIDNKVELRRVHVQVVEVRNRSDYLVAATEAGMPVDVVFEAIQVYDAGAAAFVDLANASVASIESGMYLVALRLSPGSPDKIFRLRVRHDDVVDHFGQVVFHREIVATSG